MQRGELSALPRFHYIYIMGNRDFQDSELDAYLESVSSAETGLLKELRLETEEKFSDWHMLSGHVQGRYLSLISKMLNPGHILEIGTFTGYGTLCLAEGLSENGKITTLDIDASLQEFYLPYFDRSGFREKIEPVIEDAVEYLKKSNDRYDLVFLDANKKKYTEYFELLVPKMNRGGVLLADNTLWKGKVLETIHKDDKMTQALFDFNAHVANDERVEVVLLPLRDGISLIRKK